MKIVTIIFVSCLLLCGVLLPAHAQLTREEKAKCEYLLNRKSIAEDECRKELLVKDIRDANNNKESSLTQVGGISGAQLRVNVQYSADGNLGIIGADYVNPYPQMSPEQKGEWKNKAASYKSTFLANPQAFDKQYKALDENQKAILYAAAQEEYKESVALVAQQLLSRVSEVSGGKKVNLSVNDILYALEKANARTVSATLRANADGLDSQKVDEEASAASEKVAKYAKFLSKVAKCKNCNPVK